MNESKKYLVWILVLYCLVRIPLMLLPLNALDYEMGWHEQLYRGTIAMEFMQGLRLPIWDYVDKPYGFGVLLAGIWTVPFFKVLGPTLFALKLVPLCLQLLSLLAWYFVFRRHFSARETFFMLLFLVLSPPRITQNLLINTGHHPETILWLALSVLIFRRFLDGKLSEVMGGLILGLLGGLFSSIVLTHLVTVAVIWIYLTFLKGTRIRKPVFLGFYILAFLIGFIPWLVHNSYLGGEGVAFLKSLFLETGIPSLNFPRNFYLGVRHGLRLLFSFQDLLPIPRHFFTEIYTLFYLFAVVFLLWHKRQSVFPLKNGFDIEIFGLLYQLLLFVLFIETTGFTYDRYLISMVPFMGMILVVSGIRLGEIANRVWGRRLQFTLASFCVMAGIVGNVSLIRPNELGKSLSVPGYSYGLWSSILETLFAKNPPLFFDKFKKAVEGRPPSIKKEFYQALTFNYFDFKTPEDMERIRAFIEEADPEFRPLLYEKLEKYIAEATP